MCYDKDLKSNKIRPIKIISSLLIVTFFFQEVSFAAHDIKPIQWNPSPKPAIHFTIPASAGTVEDSYKGTDSKTLILIQDAHTNTSGQFNAARILDAIFSTDPVKYVFLEAGQGDESLSFLKKYASQEKRESVAKSFVINGKLQGTEYENLISDKDFVLWGVEDMALYAQSVESYRAVAKERDRLESYLDKVTTTIDSLKEKLYNPFLKSFDGKIQKYRKNELSITDYTNTLLESAKAFNVSLDSYSNLEKISHLKGLESAIDFGKANDEENKAVQTLSPEDQKELLEAQHQTSKLSIKDEAIQKAFFILLQEKLSAKLSSPNALVGDQPVDSRLKIAGMTMEAAYPELSKYLNYLKASETINPKEVLKEQKSLEEAIYKTLIQTDDEASLVQASKNIDYLKKMFNLTLTPEEFDEYQKNKEAFDIERITGFLNKKIMDLKTDYERVAFLEQGYGDVMKRSEDFYKLTYQRNQKFIENSLKKMDEDHQTEAVLVTGGYHTPNLKELLKQKNISYISITPNILQETNQKRYEKLLLGQNISRLNMPLTSSAHTIEVMRLLWQGLLGAPDDKVFVQSLTDNSQALLETQAHEAALMNRGARLAKGQTESSYDLKGLLVETRTIDWSLFPADFGDTVLKIKGSGNPVDGAKYTITVMDSQGKPVSSYTLLYGFVKTDFERDILTGGKYTAHESIAMKAALDFYRKFPAARYKNASPIDVAEALGAISIYKKAATPSESARLAGRLEQIRLNADQKFSEAVAKAKTLGDAESAKVILQAQAERNAALEYIRSEVERKNPSASAASMAALPFLGAASVAGNPENEASRRTFVKTAAAGAAAVALFGKSVLGQAKNQAQKTATEFKYKASETAGNLRFLESNVTASELPLSFRAPKGYWKSIGSRKDDLDDTLERILTGEADFPKPGAEGTVNTYDAGAWQIALSLGKKFKAATAHTLRLLSGRSGDLSTIRAYQEPFSYGEKKEKMAAEEAYPFRMITDRWRKVDPLDGSEENALFPANEFIGKGLRHEDWKAITGEAVWADLIGPLQAAFEEYGDKIPLDHPAMQNAVTKLNTYLKMQSPIGALYHASHGTEGKDPRDVSTENNASAWAGINLLKEALLPYKNNNAAKASLDKIDLLLYGKDARGKKIKKGIEDYFKEYAFDKKNGLFYQGGLVIDGVFHPSADFAVDVQTWTVASLGADWITREVGGGDASTVFKIWQATKKRGGYYDEKGVLRGVGFTDGHDILSSEWTFGAILMVKEMAHYYEGLSKAKDDRYQKAADILWKEADQMDAGVESLRVELPDGQVAYKYANKRYYIVFGWWANPIPSLAGTNWAVMMRRPDPRNYYNPFKKRGGKYATPLPAAALEKGKVSGAKQKAPEKALELATTDTYSGGSNANGWRAWFINNQEVDKLDRFQTMEVTVTPRKGQKSFQFMVFVQGDSFKIFSKVFRVPAANAKSGEAFTVRIPMAEVIKEMNKTAPGKKPVINEIHIANGAQFKEVQDLNPGDNSEKFQDGAAPSIRLIEKPSGARLASAWELNRQALHDAVNFDRRLKAAENTFPAQTALKELKTYQSLRDQLGSKYNEAKERAFVEAYDEAISREMELQGARLAIVLRAQLEEGVEAVLESVHARAGVPVHLFFDGRELDVYTGQFNVVAKSLVEAADAVYSEAFAVFEGSDHVFVEPAYKVGSRMAKPGRWSKVVGWVKGLGSSDKTKKYRTRIKASNHKLGSGMENLEDRRTLTAPGTLDLPDSVSPVVNPPADQENVIEIVRQDANHVPQLQIDLNQLRPALQGLTPDNHLVVIAHPDAGSEAPVKVFDETYAALAAEVGDTLTVPLAGINDLNDDNSAHADDYYFENHDSAGNRIGGSFDRGFIFDVALPYMAEPSGVASISSGTTPGVTISRQAATDYILSQDQAVRADGEFDLFDDGQPIGQPIKFSDVSAASGDVTENLPTGTTGDITIQARDVDRLDILASVESPVGTISATAAPITTAIFNGGGSSSVQIDAPDDHTFILTDLTQAGSFVWKFNTIDGTLSYTIPGPETIGTYKTGTYDYVTNFPLLLNKLNHDLGFNVASVNGNSQPTADQIAGAKKMLQNFIDAMQPYAPVATVDVTTSAGTVREFYGHVYIVIPPTQNGGPQSDTWVVDTNQKTVTLVDPIGITPPSTKNYNSDSQGYNTLKGALDELNKIHDAGTQDQQTAVAPVITTLQNELNSSPLTPVTTASFYLGGSSPFVINASDSQTFTYTVFTPMGSDVTSFNKTTGVIQSKSGSQPLMTYQPNTAGYADAYFAKGLQHVLDNGTVVGVNGNTQPTVGQIAAAKQWLTGLIAEMAPYAPEIDVDVDNTKGDRVQESYGHFYKIVNQLQMGWNIDTDKQTIERVVYAPSSSTTYNYFSDPSGLTELKSARNTVQDILNLETDPTEQPKIQKALDNLDQAIAAAAANQAPIITATFNGGGSSSSQIDAPNDHTFILTDLTQTGSFVWNFNTTDGTISYTIPGPETIGTYKPGTPDYIDTFPVLLNKLQSRLNWNVLSANGNNQPTADQITGAKQMLQNFINAMQPFAPVATVDVNTPNGRVQEYYGHIFTITPPTNTTGGPQSDTWVIDTNAKTVTLKDPIGVNPPSTKNYNTDAQGYSTLKDALAELNKIHDAATQDQQTAVAPVITTLQNELNSSPLTPAPKLEFNSQSLIVNSYVDQDNAKSFIIAQASVGNSGNAVGQAKLVAFVQAQGSQTIQKFETPLADVPTVQSSAETGGSQSFHLEMPIALGTYSVRVEAEDANGNTIGQSSNAQTVIVSGALFTFDSQNVAINPSIDQNGKSSINVQAPIINSGNQSAQVQLEVAIRPKGDDASTVQSYKTPLKDVSPNGQNQTFDLQIPETPGDYVVSVEFVDAKGILVGTPLYNQAVTVPTIPVKNPTPPVVGPPAPVTTPPVVAPPTPTRSQQIADIYQNVLRRTAGASEIASWENTSLTVDQILSEVEKSDEGFIVKTYEELLGRAPELDARNFWMNFLSNKTRDQFTAAIENSPEYAVKRISADYQAFLGRAPEAKGLQFWLSQHENGESWADIDSSIQNSAEAQARRQNANGARLSTVPAVLQASASPAGLAEREHAAALNFEPPAASLPTLSPEDRRNLEDLTLNVFYNRHDQALGKLFTVLSQAELNEYFIRGTKDKDGKVVRLDLMMALGRDAEPLVTISDIPAALAKLRKAEANQDQKTMHAQDLISLIRLESLNTEIALPGTLVKNTSASLAEHFDLTYFAGITDNGRFEAQIELLLRHIADKDHADKLNRRSMAFYVDSTGLDPIRKGIADRLIGRFQAARSGNAADFDGIVIDVLPMDQKFTNIGNRLVFRLNPMDSRGDDFIKWSELMQAAELSARELAQYSHKENGKTIIDFDRAAASASNFSPMLLAFLQAHAAGSPAFGAIIEAMSGKGGRIGYQFFAGKIPVDEIIQGARIAFMEIGRAA